MFWDSATVVLKSVCGGGGGLISFEHKFIFNCDVYDVVIEKVVGYHFNS